MLPSVVAHADWSVDRSKRLMAIAKLVPGSGYRVVSLAAAPDGRGGDGALFQVLGDMSHPGRSVVGFDFPIGLPSKYAAAAGIGSFPEFLDTFGSPPWREFDVVAERSSQIALRRPFYPSRPGGTRREQLYQGLGLSATDLRRRCEGTDAETLFWTLGGKQVGKAALTGWRLLRQARQGEPGIRLWPFDGPLPDLLAGSGQVVAETYPREYAVTWARRPAASAGASVAVKTGSRSCPVCSDGRSPSRSRGTFASFSASRRASPTAGPARTSSTRWSACSRSSAW